MKFNNNTLIKKTNFVNLVQYKPNTFLFLTLLKLFDKASFIIITKLRPHYLTVVKLWNRSKQKKLGSCKNMTLLTPEQN